MSDEHKKVALRAVRAVAEAVEEFDLYPDEAAAFEKVLVICMREATR